MKKIPAFLLSVNCCLMASICYADVAQRVWNNGWAVGVSTQISAQTNCRIISDGSGGAIVAWQDMRNANIDIYVRRVNSYGTPQWQHGGTAVCEALGSQVEPVLVSDGCSHL